MIYDSTIEFGESGSDMEKFSGFWLSHQIARFKSWCLSFSFLHFLQQYKLKKLIKYAKKSIPYYQAFSAKSFHQLPIIDKTVMQENFQMMNTKGVSLESIKDDDYLQDLPFANHSLGTSGEPSVYLYSAHEKSEELHSLLAKIAPINLFPQKVAIFYLSQRPYFANINTSFLKWRFFDLKTDIERLITNLNQFSPDVLIAPVQTLCKLALYQNENKISLKPKKIIATFEVLTPFEEKLIATTFSQNVHQLYQCAEGFLGTTCEMGVLHLNEEHYYIEKEWIDDKKEKFVPVITALHRFHHPLIRYRMNDILNIKKTACSCGSPHTAVEGIIGRCEDMLYFQKYGNNPSLKTVFADDIHLAIGRASGGIEKYQLLQSSPLSVEIKLKATNFALAKHCISQQLEKLAHSLGVRCPFFEFTTLDAPPTSSLFRQTMRLVKNAL